MATVPGWRAQSNGCDICDFQSDRVNALLETQGLLWCGAAGVNNVLERIGGWENK